jgi:hypothetical protein
MIVSTGSLDACGRVRAGCAALFLLLNGKKKYVVIEQPFPPFRNVVNRDQRRKFCSWISFLD